MGVELPTTEGSVIETTAGDWFALVSEPEGDPLRWLGGPANYIEPRELDESDEVSHVIILASPPPPLL